MRFVSYETAGGRGLAVRTGSNTYRGMLETDKAYPGSLDELLKLGGDSLNLAAAALAKSEEIELAEIRYLPPLQEPGKILCVGLNYHDHAEETHSAVGDYPVIFGRFPSSLIGHRQALIAPRVSSAFDFEAELVAVIGVRGRHIPAETALSHVAGYSIFNDASVRDYQFKTHQWTIGKNFDGTGAFGPEFVTADEVSAGAKGLGIRCLLNGETVQEANTSQMIFDVQRLIAIISEAMTLDPGDIIVTGTPGGIGATRNPPLWMKPGDHCSVEIDGIGVLENRVVAEV